jgi:hypothetical protein
MKVAQGQDSVDRCDAEIGSNEPRIINAALCIYGGFTTKSANCKVAAAAPPAQSCIWTPT